MMARTASKGVCESCGATVPGWHTDPSPGHGRCPACVSSDREHAARGNAPVLGHAGAAHTGNPAPRVHTTTGSRPLPALPALSPVRPTTDAASPTRTPTVTTMPLPALPVLPRLGALAVALALVLPSLAATGCDPTRRAALRVVAGPSAGCAEGAYRCHAGAPEVCSASGRWHPVLPAALDGTSRACTGSCRIDPRDGVAACSPLPPDADPAEGVPVPLPGTRPPSQAGTSGSM